MRFTLVAIFCFASLAQADVSHTAVGLVNQEAFTSSFLNLGQADSKLLAAICEAATINDENFPYNLAENHRADKVTQGVAEVNMMALYTELAKRCVSGDDDARRALTMSILRGDRRAREAKTLAFQDKLADTLLERITDGDQGAREELEKLAAKGNAKAKSYLEMNRPPTTPLPLSGAATVEPADVTETVVD